MTIEVKPGKYKHSKSGKNYRAIGVARHSETLEEYVAYEALYDNPTSKFWVRPLEMFTETIQIDSKSLPRFEYVGPLEEEKMRVGVGITVVNTKGQILLGKRKGGYQAGLYAVPAGHVNLGESEGILEAAVRELREETGFRISRKSFNLISLSTFTDSQKERSYINFDFVVLGASKEPKLKEPEKCEGWEWFDLNELPPQKNFHTPALLAIKAYKRWKKSGRVYIPN